MSFVCNTCKSAYPAAIENQNLMPPDENFGLSLKQIPKIQLSIQFCYLYWEFGVIDSKPRPQITPTFKRTSETNNTPEDLRNGIIRIRRRMLVFPSV